MQVVSGPPTERLEALPQAPPHEMPQQEPTQPASSCPKLQHIHLPSPKRATCLVGTLG
ncbi:hypothetical protein BX600DRAFT_451050 [Xylariales sp. PMI_506]|nr:hypothetical protein BX600DRAFT_451050 [Xylariales sp. PMI_506]